MLPSKKDAMEKLAKLSFTPELGEAWANAGPDKFKGEESGLQDLFCRMLATKWAFDLSLLPMELREAIIANLEPWRPEDPEQWKPALRMAHAEEMFLESVGAMLHGNGNGMFWGMFHYEKMLFEIVNCQTTHGFSKELRDEWRDVAETWLSIRKRFDIFDSGEGK